MGLIEKGRTACFMVELSEDNKTMVMTELCDMYIVDNFNKSQVKELIDWFQSIHDGMEE